MKMALDGWLITPVDVRAFSLMVVVQRKRLQIALALPPLNEQFSIVGRKADMDIAF
jgi:hypothetical protein